MMNILIYIYICYVYIYIYIYIYMCVCVCVYIYIYINTVYVFTQYMLIHSAVYSTTDIYAIIMLNVYYVLY